jgi:uncharacterized protein (TIGR00369 family)
VAVSRLDPKDWGFATNCFVCDPSNERGLGIPFYYDDESRTVGADFCLDDRFSGTPSYVHGGVTMAVLDEAMAWSAIAVAKVFVLTRSTSVTFQRPVRIGKDHRVEARVSSRATEDTLIAAAAVRDARGRTCAEAEAEFTVMSVEQAASAIGHGGADYGSYLRP